MQHIVITLKAALKQLDNGVEYRKNYSGRGMYGADCIGIVGQLSDCQEVIAATINELIAEDNCNPDDVKTLLTFNWDSMGLDSIVYWKDLQDESDDPNFSDFFNSLPIEEQDLLNDWQIWYEETGKVPKKEMAANLQLTEKLEEFFEEDDYELIMQAVSECSED